MQSMGLIARESHLMAVEPFVVIVQRFVYMTFDVIIVFKNPLHLWLLLNRF